MKMRPSRSTVTTSPDFGSSGFASARGKRTSTPPCMIGAVIMKMIRSTNATSTSDVTLMSAFKGSSPCPRRDRKSTRLNSSHLVISYAVFCLKKKKHFLQVLILLFANRQNMHDCKLAQRIKLNNCPADQVVDGPDFDFAGFICTHQDVKVFLL